MKTLLATALLAALSFNASAADDSWSIGVEKGLFTTHIAVERNDGEEWNEDNNLIGLELRKGDWAIQYSQFSNSFGNDAWTFGVDYTAFEWNNFQLGVSAGLVDGYTKEENKVNISNTLGAYVAGSVAYKYELTDHVSITPTVRLFGAAVVGSVKLSYEF